VRHRILAKEVDPYDARCSCTASSRATQIGRASSALPGNGRTGYFFLLLCMAVVLLAGLSWRQQTTVYRPLTTERNSRDVRPRQAVHTSHRRREHTVDRQFPGASLLWCSRLAERSSTTAGVGAHLGVDIGSVAKGRNPMLTRLCRRRFPLPRERLAKFLLSLLPGSWT